MTAIITRGSIIFALAILFTATSVLGQRIGEQKAADGADPKQTEAPKTKTPVSAESISKTVSTKFVAVHGSFAGEIHVTNTAHRPRLSPTLSDQAAPTEPASNGPNPADLTTRAEMKYQFQSLGSGYLHGVPAQEKVEGEELPRIEVFGGYSLLRAEGHNFHGWKAAASFNLNRWFAIAGDLDGHYFTEKTASGTEKRREYSATVGPHFAHRNKSKFVLFAYAMPGVVWESTSHAGHGETKTGFAFEAGGGVDLELSRKVALRLVDISASTTHIDGHTSTKPKFSTGIVFHFGRR